MSFMAPNNPQHRLSQYDAHRIDAARFAMRMHMSLAEVYAMPMAHYGTLVDVMRAEDEIKRVQDHRAAARRGNPPAASASRRGARARRHYR